MSEWRQWCKGSDDMEVDGGTIEVSLPDGRRHRVDVGERDELVVLRAKVASRTALSRMDDPAIWVWKRNRVVPLVGFRLDRYDSLIGEVRLLGTGLQPDEFLLHVRVLAAECDRLEVLLTGDDVE